MTPEQALQPELTAEQQEIADLLIEQCDLQDYADVNLEMMGVSESVRYGLGRCAHHFMDRTPEEIRLMVMAKLDQQATES